ncbi:MAG: Hsp20/alpha crystallin family protein [bacterium]
MKKSFFRRITGSQIEEEDDKTLEIEKPDFLDNDDSEGELTVDVYETPSHIIVKTLIAGVKKEDMDIALSRDMVAIRGKRELEESIEEDNYFHRELYWGTFSRTILLPQEVDIEKAEAVENQGMLTIRLPKIDKGRQTKLKVKSL